MAKQTQIVDLIKAAYSGNKGRIEQVIADIIANERDIRGESLYANRLEDLVRSNATSHHILGQALDQTVADTLHNRVPQRELSSLVLSTRNRNAINKVINDHAQIEVLANHGLTPRNRVMLVGPPGNGKTSLAEAMAKQLNLPFYVVRYEGLVGSFLGQTSGRLAKVFDYASRQPCVLFFDEFDAIGKDRADSREVGEMGRIVSSLLLQIDALPATTIVVVASNHAEMLDSAAWRRFQVRIELPQPTTEQLAQFIDDYQARTSTSFGKKSNDIILQVGEFDAFSGVEDFCKDVHRYSAIYGHDPTPQFDSGGTKALWEAIVDWREHLLIVKDDCLE